jgi:hypothetical protein
VIARLLHMLTGERTNSRFLAAKMMRATWREVILAAVLSRCRPSSVLLKQRLKASNDGTQISTLRCDKNHCRTQMRNYNIRKQAIMCVGKGMLQNRFSLCSSAMPRHGMYLLAVAIAKASRFVSNKMKHQKNTTSDAGS